MLKKLLSILCIVTLMLTLVSCGEQSKDDGKDPGNGNVPEDKPIVKPDDKDPPEETEKEKIEKILQLCTDFSIFDYKGYEYYSEQTTDGKLSNSTQIELVFDKNKEEAKKITNRKQLNDDIFGEEYIEVNTTAELKNGTVTTVTNDNNTDKTRMDFDEFVKLSLKGLNIKETNIKDSELVELNGKILKLEVKDGFTSEFFGSTVFKDFVIKINTNDETTEVKRVSMNFSSENSEYSISLTLNK